MTPADEQELHRLTNLLESLHELPELDSACREALKKAALALSVTFIHGMRPEMERLFVSLGKPLSEDRP